MVCRCVESYSESDFAKYVCLVTNICFLRIFAESYKRYNLLLMKKIYLLIASIACSCTINAALTKFGLINIDDLNRSRLIEANAESTPYSITCTGTATYDSEKETLTLTDFNYTGQGQAFEIQCDGNLTIVINGTNTIGRFQLFNTDSGTGTCTITGGGSLTISRPSVPIYLENSDLVIDNTDVTVTYEAESGYSVFAKSITLTKCFIETPSNGKINDDFWEHSIIEDSEGGAATAVHIAKQEPLKVGDKFSILTAGAPDFNLFYTVTKACTDGTGGTVSLSPETKSGYSSYAPNGDIVIPSTVTAPATDETFNVTAIDAKALSDISLLKSVTISEGIITIGENFNNNSQLEEVVIPASVTSIAAYSFVNTRNLQSISVSKTNTQYSSVNGALYSKDKTIIYHYPSADPTYFSGDLTGVTKIMSNAFLNYEHMPDSLYIPAGIQYEEAFHDTNVRILYIDGTTVDKDAFQISQKLEKLYLGEDITIIKQLNFRAAESLKEVYVLSPALPDWEYGTDTSFSSFSDCNFGTAILYVQCGLKDKCEKDTYKWANFKNIVEIIPYTVTLGATENGTTAIVDNPGNTCDQVTIEATPDPGYKLNGWSVYGITSGNRITVNVGGDITVTAYFYKIPADITEEQITEPSANTAKKIIHNGQIYILRNGRTYDILGREVMIDIR